jgi:hypothetical protein
MEGKAMFLKPKMLQSNGFKLDEFKEWWVYKTKKEKG